MSSVAPETIMRRHNRQSSNSIVVNSLPEGDERLFGVVGLTVNALLVAGGLTLFRAGVWR
jgi:hypothetical protein